MGKKLEELIELRSELMTPDQVAEILGLSVHTLEKWRVTRRNLPFLKIGRKVRYRAQDIADFLEPKQAASRGRRARKAAYLHASTG